MNCSLEIVNTLTKMKKMNRDIKYNFNVNYKNQQNRFHREEEAFAIRLKFPTKIPIVVERHTKDELPLLVKRKFLVPQEISLSQFLNIIRNNLKVSQNRAIFLLVNNRSMVSLSKTVGETYCEFKNPDGFLYITYASQEVFG